MGLGLMLEGGAEGKLEHWQVQAQVQVLRKNHSL